MQFPALLSAIFIGCLTTFTFNSLGLLKSSEFLLYDHYLRSRPSETTNNSIIIVGITETDIDKLQFPLEDKTLANLLIKIQQGNPSVMGMDLHRKGSFGDGKEQLNTVFKNSDNLIAVEKTDGGNSENETISAPTTLKKRELTGASQIIEDSSNGIVRRGYLYAKQSQSKDLLPGFGLAVALKHLERKKIYPSGAEDNNWLKLKESIFPQLNENFFYEDIQIDGYQTLINYRSTENKYKIISVSEILDNKVNPKIFRDKIVFIGTVAETVDDLYLTPYNSTSQNSNFIFGVEIHAELTDQIIQATLNNRSIIRPANTVSFISLGLLYLIIISCLAWSLFADKKTDNQQVHYLLYFLGSLFIPLGCGYLLLIAGYWIPTATIFIASLSSEIIIYIRLLKHHNKLNEDKLEETRKLVLSQERLKVHSKSISLISHEIKNIVNILQSSADLAVDAVKEIKSFVEEISILLDPGDEASINSFINDTNEELLTILEESRKITSTINRIHFDFSDKPISIQSAGDEKTSLNLVDSLNRNLRLLERSYRVKDKTINLHISKDFQLDIVEQIKISLETERAFANITENAFYFAVKKSQNQNNNWIAEVKVSLKEKKQDKKIELKIRDNGPGISSKNINKIFGDFWTTKPKGEGMGLGLYIAMQSIQKINGNITVISNEGEFTEFTILFPVPT